MKKIVSALIINLMAIPALATIDGHTRVYLVVQNVQDPEDFFVERAPIIGCYGLNQGPQLIQFTSEYKATSNIGCGGEPVSENINYLTCASVVKSKESPDYDGFSEITLDISKCDQKNNKKFITMVRTAAKLNFPQKKGEVKLHLIK